MSITNEAGQTLTESAMNALTDDVAAPPTMVTVTEDIWQRFTAEGQTGPKAFEAQTRLLFHEGQVVAQSAVDALFADATIDTVLPATGPAAGGTAIKITGTNFGGVSGVTVGGVACTNVRVVSEKVISCTTGAHAAGAVNVVVTDDSGAVTKTNGYTYT
jgi:hypothetical protein